MKRIICKIFGHSPLLEGNEHHLVHSDIKTATFRCKRCKSRLFGIYKWGELSKQYLWSYAEMKEDNPSPHN